jgi:hypothetical protein
MREIKADKEGGTLFFEIIKKRFCQKQEHIGKSVLALNCFQVINYNLANFKKQQQIILYNFR